MLKPLGSRIIVEVLDEPVSSVIIVPNTTREPSGKGKVIAVGEGRRLDNGKRITTDIAIGDCVLFSKFAGKEVQHEGKEYLIIHTKDVLAIVE